MSFFDMAKSVIENYTANSDHAAVAGGLLEQVQSSGGLGGLMQTLQQNGAGNLVSQWTSGQTQPTDSGAVEQGLGSTGIVEAIAERTGIAPETVKSSLATILPVLLHHATSTGQISEDGQATANGEPDMGSLLQSVLAKLT